MESLEQLSIVNQPLFKSFLFYFIFYLRYNFIHPMHQFNNPEASQLNFTKVHQRQGIVTDRKYHSNPSGLVNVANDAYNLYSQQLVGSQQVSTNRSSKFQNKFSFKKDTGNRYVKANEIIFKSTIAQRKQINQNHIIATSNQPVTFQRPQTVDRPLVVPVEQVRDTSYNYILQIRQLKNRIQFLQGQKLAMGHKIRYFEESNAAFHKSSQQKIEEYRQEVQNLRAKNQELNVYCENRNQLQRQIFNLKESASKYLQQIELVQKQKLTFAKLLNQRQSQNAGLHHKLDSIQRQRLKNTAELNQRSLQISRLTSELSTVKLELKRLQNQKLVSMQKRVIEEIHHKEKHNELLILYVKSNLQAIVLLSEIKRLNIILQQTEGNLKRAQQQTVWLQESLSRNKFQLQNIDRTTKSPAKDQLDQGSTSNSIAEFTKTIHELQKSVQQLQSQNQLLVRERDALNYKLTVSQPDFKQINQLQSRLQISEITIRQYEQEISRLKFDRQQLQHNNSNLAIERDQFLLKISSLLSNLQQRVEAPLQQEERELLQFQEQIRQLNLQLQLKQEQLRRAEIVIFQSQNSWNERKVIQAETVERQQYQNINQLINDIEYLKQNNQELAERIESQNDVVEQNRLLRMENQRLYEDINRYQSNQMQSQAEYEKILQTLRQVEDHLKTGSAEESQQQIYGLRMQVQGLANQIAHLKEQNNKLSEVEEHLIKAESYIRQIEERILLMIQTYQAQITSLKDHMQKANLQIERLQVYQALGQSFNEEQGDNL